MAKLDLGRVVGATFTPQINEGILSWTNDAGLDNPTAVSIIGPEGPPGPAGQDTIIKIGGVKVTEVNFTSDPQEQLNLKYEKPEEGIPENDLTQEVQNKLNTSGIVVDISNYIDPNTGKISIPASLLIEPVKKYIAGSNVRLVGEVTVESGSGKMIYDIISVNEVTLQEGILYTVSLSTVSAGLDLPLAIDMISIAFNANNPDYIIDITKNPISPVEYTYASDLRPIAKYAKYDENGGLITDYYKKPSNGILESDLSAELQLKINEVKIVEANPTEEATEDLTKIKIDSTIYQLPAGEITISDQKKENVDTIKSVTINGTSYNIGGGYEKPSSGIPESDLSAELQAKIDSIGNINTILESILGV